MSNAHPNLVENVLKLVKSMIEHEPPIYQSVIIGDRGEYAGITHHEHFADVANALDKIGCVYRAALDHGKPCLYVCWSEAGEREREYQKTIAAEDDAGPIELNICAECGSKRDADWWCTTCYGPKPKDYKNPFRKETQQ